MTAFRWLLVAGALVVVPRATKAQPRARVAGVLLRPSGTDAMAVANARVVLHRVGRATQGPIDTVLTSPTGQFQFRFQADTTANYLVSARHHGVEYFSNPIATNPARPDTALKLLVYDTASSAPVRVKSRTMVVSSPDAIGARTVVDWLVLENRGSTTRVGVDSLAPTWVGRLPEEARNTQVGDARLSQFSPDAVQFRGDSLLVTAPISPGEKELLIQYEIPASQNRLAVNLGAADSVDVFLEEQGIGAPGRGWAVTDSQMFEGRRFRRLTRTDQRVAGLDLRLPGLAFDPTRLLPWLVGGFALAMLAGGWRVLGRPRPALAHDPVLLADRIVELDRAAESGPAEQRAALIEQRRRLMDQLDATLAERRRGS